MGDFFVDKSILITGACGTIGSGLIQELLLEKYKIKKIIALDNNENSTFYNDALHIKDHRIEYFVADISQYENISKYFLGVDLVIHAAAMKHVGMCEASPESAATVNINGTLNVIKACKQFSVSKCIFTSSDKAVNPTNTMGATKLIGEKMIISSNINSPTQFSCTRFGNVIGSNGSVLNVFRKQRDNNLPYSITNVGMTRFLMSKSQAVNLILEALENTLGGEIFVSKMDAFNIVDLATAFHLSGNKGNKVSEFNYEVIGSKPGEKLYEELFTYDELERTFDLGSMYVVLPNLLERYCDFNKLKSYFTGNLASVEPDSRTSPKLTVGEISEILANLNALN